jgi:hypothetical protein
VGLVGPQTHERDHRRGVDHASPVDNRGIYEAKVATQANVVSARAAKLGSLNRCKLRREFIPERHQVTIFHGCMLSQFASVTQDCDAGIDDMLSSPVYSGGSGCAAERLERWASPSRPAAFS